MSRRLATPDTPADVALRAVLDAQPCPTFVVVAGAGSGKTTSLVKALSHVVTQHGATLRARTQQVACITYTEIAAHEIHEEVGASELAHVSTIHSFLWRLIKPFQTDIHGWVEGRIKEKLLKEHEDQAKFTTRTRQTTRDANKQKIARYEQQLADLPGVTRFTYGVGSSYTHGILGHTDILAMVPALLMSRPLLARLTAVKFPFIFVDESQDTTAEVVECLVHVAETAAGEVCLGFFGDPMQRIYPTGIGRIPSGDDWPSIEKPENFRSAEKVLEVVNRVRADADGLHQVSGLPEDQQREGSAHFFVLPADDQRDENLEKVRAWLTGHGTAGCWTTEASDGGAKILMIAHRMAARRLRFLDLFEVFNKTTLAEAFDAGRAWPLTPFSDVILPLVQADAPVVRTLRAHSRVLSNGTLSETSLTEALKASRAGLEELRAIVTAGGPGSIGAALRSATASGILDPDPRLNAYLHPDDGADVELSDELRACLDACMACDIAELSGYYEYVEQRSPYSTQHGTKGAEFPRVLVVLDDEEGRHNQYSYDKLFGLRSLSDTDNNNIDAGKDSVLDRTRRLLYVCVSRATDALAVVLFAQDVAAAAAAMEAGIAGGQPVRTLNEI
jgi:DNA helicase II / ATP-dependent DNA helicase PcrA